MAQAPTQHTAPPPATSEYTLTPRTPTPSEHTHLRQISGLRTSFPATATAIALPRSIHSVIITHSSSPTEAIAMGRLVGDGQLFLQIVDMAVDPKHQRKGLGKMILRALLEWVDREAKEAYVSLIADPPGRRLYESCGFVGTGDSVAMFLLREGQAGP